MYSRVVTSEKSLDQSCLKIGAKMCQEIFRCFAVPGCCKVTDPAHRSKDGQEEYEPFEHSLALLPRCRAALCAVCSMVQLHESASFVMFCCVLLCFAGMTWYDQCDPIRSHSIPEWPQSGLFPQCPTGPVVIFTAVRIWLKIKGLCFSTRPV